MTNGRVLELEDLMPLIKKHYTNISSFNDLDNIIKNKHLFLYFKNKNLYVFGEFLNPKIKVFSDEVFLKLKKLKKLSDSDIKDLNKLLLELKSLENESIKLEQNLRNIVKTIDFPKDELRLNISNHCNMQCSYCFQKEKNNQSLSLDQAYRHIDAFVESYPYSKPIKITISMTSEPFLDLSKIRKIYYYFQEKCLEKIKKEVNKQDIFNFLSIKSDEEYKKLISDSSFYKKLLENTEPRYISQKLSLILKGETFLLPTDEIMQINEEAIYCAYSASLSKYYLWFCTNGTITPSKVDLAFIKTLFKNDHLGISLDGNFRQSINRVNNKELYKKIISNINLFQKNGIALEAHCTLTNNNHNIKKIIKFYNKLGITKFHFGIEKGLYSKKLISNIQKAYHLGHKKGLTLGGLDDYRSIIEGKGIQLSCYAKKTLCIGPDNNQYFCDYFISKQSQKLYDNITIFDRPECQSCPFKIICGGTCLALTNNLSTHKEACALKKSLIKQVIFEYF